MAQRNINYGATPNDGAGDTLRDALIKVQDNFTELYDLSDDYAQPVADANARIDALDDRVDGVDTRITNLDNRIDVSLNEDGTIKDGVIALADLSAEVKSAIASGGNAQPKNANLDALSALAGAADMLAYFTGPGVMNLTALSSFIRGLLDDADAASARNTLGIAPAFDSVAALVASKGTSTSSVSTLGYTAPGDKGHATYVKTNANTGVYVTDAGGQKWALVPDSNRLVYQLGAKGGGAGDDTSAYATALANFNEVRIPADTFNITNIVVSRNGAKLKGAGSTSSKLVCTNNSSTGININGGLNDVALENFTVDRTGVAAQGTFGIDCSTVIVGQSRIANIMTRNQYHGLGLGSTDHSIVEDVISEKNQGAGILMKNVSNSGTVQWNMKHVLVQKNGQQGILFQAVAGPSAVALGTFFWVDTYANSGAGIAIVGLAGTPVNGFRLLGGFIGEDGSSEVFLDTYGSSHTINSCFIELPGTTATGPNVGNAAATAASKTGSGIDVTSNNKNVLISGTTITGCSVDGIVSSAESIAITGCTLRNNGVALTGRQNGIYIASGRAVITGCMSGNVGQSTSQRYGVYAANGNNITVIGCDLTNNASGPVGADTNLTYAGMAANLPNTLNTQLAANGPMLVGGAVTGVVNSAGVINTSGGIVKNGTAYSNP